MKMKPIWLKEEDSVATPCVYVQDGMKGIGKIALCVCLCTEREMESKCVRAHLNA